MELPVAMRCRQEHKFQRKMEMSPSVLPEDKWDETESDLNLDVFLFPVEFMTLFHIGFSLLPFKPTT